MLYSPKRKGLSVLPNRDGRAGVFSHQRHGLQTLLKDANGSRMACGYRTLGKASTTFLRAFPVVLMAGVFAVSAAPRARAQSASKWDKRGQVAESHQDYAAAMNDYHQAL